MLLNEHLPEILITIILVFAVVITAAFFVLHWARSLRRKAERNVQANTEET